MKVDVYQQICQRTAGVTVTPGQANWLAMSAGKPQPIELQRLNWTLGLAGEVGEFVEEVKKQTFHDHPIDRDKVIKELGDIAWYLAMAASTYGIPLSEVLAHNVAKLHDRYPQGFDPQRSQARNPKGLPSFVHDYREEPYRA